MAEYLSRYTEWFMKLGELSLLLNEPEARWQFAIRLKEMTDKKRAGVLLEKFVNDDNEYVSRRALMELPALLPDKVEAYSTWFWPRDVYGDWQEYQRMAVLTALKEIRSPLLWGISKTSKRGWTNLSCPVRGRDFFRNTKDAGGIKTPYRHMLSLSFEYVPVIYLPDGQYRFHGSARQRKAAGSCRPREQERSTP